MHRGFTLAPAESKNLVLRSRSLHTATEQGVAAYSPTDNAWARKISDVVVREIVILGLPSKPSCIRKASGGDVGLDFDWSDGVAATAGRRRGGKKATELVIKDAGAIITEDWDLVFDFGVACGVTPAVDHDAALQSAECAAGQFRCQNDGHIPSCILLSRVNDSVCDPECCDGSDETDGKTQCGDRCAVIGASFRKTRDEEARKRRVGAAVRKEYIIFGAKEKSRLEVEVEQIAKDIAKLEAREATAKASLDIMETAEAGDTERKKSSVLYQQIIEMQSAIKALRTHRTNLEAHVSDLSSILGDLSVSHLSPYYKPQGLCSLL